MKHQLGGFNAKKLKKSTVNFFGNMGYPQMPIENVNALDDSMYNNIYGDNQQQLRHDRKNGNLPMYTSIYSGDMAGQTGYIQNGQMISEGFNNNLNNNNMNYLPNFRSKMQNNPSYLPNFMQMGGEQSPEDQMQDQQMQQAPQQGGDPQQMAQQIVDMFQKLPPELQQAVMQALMGDGGQQEQPQQKMGGYNNPGFRNLPQSVQDKIKRNS